MTTIDALKNLSIAAGCGEATGDTTAEKSLFGFATSGGTGAQFTDIKVIKL